MTATKQHPRERGILFSEPMRAAINEDRKTQTRRVVTVPWKNGKRCQPYEPYWVVEEGKVYRMDEAGEFHEWYQYGAPGDLLYVKETHYRYGHWRKNGVTKTGRQRWRFVADTDEVRYVDAPPENVRRNSYRKRGWYKRSALFMPRAAARLWLEITDVRVQRLQAIDQEVGEADIRAEGAPEDIVSHLALRVWFMDLWDSINSARGYGWDTNPWVGALTFRKVARAAQEGGVVESSGMTTVVNAWTDEFDVYIGRAVSRAIDPRCRKASPYANPYRIGTRPTLRTHEQAMVEYESLWRHRLAGPRRHLWFERLEALRGKRLGFLAMADRWHGDVLIRLLDQFGNPGAIDVGH